MTSITLVFRVGEGGCGGVAVGRGGLAWLLVDSSTREGEGQQQALPSCIRGGVCRCEERRRSSNALRAENTREDAMIFHWQKLAHQCLAPITHIRHALVQTLVVSNTAKPSRAYVSDIRELVVQRSVQRYRSMSSLGTIVFWVGSDVHKWQARRGAGRLPYASTA